MTRLLRPLIPALVASCLALTALTLALAALLRLDPVRVDVSVVVPYLPGSPRPDASCFEGFEYHIYSMIWWCRVETADALYVSGRGETVDHTTLSLPDARLGDVLAALPAPDTVTRYRLVVIYRWQDGARLITVRRGGLMARASYVAWDGAR